MIYKGICYAIPLSKRTKRPSSEWKTEDKSKVVDFKKSDFKNKDVGLVPMRGFICLDFDNKDGKNGYKSMEMLCITKGETLTQDTPSGGCHMIYKVPLDCQLRNIVGIMDGLDLRTAEMGYFKLYNTWFDFEDHEIGADKVEHLPEEIISQLLSFQKKKYNERKESSIESDIIENRNSTLTSIAGEIWAKGCTVDELYNYLHGINARRCKPSLYQKEIDSICGSITKYKREEKATQNELEEMQSSILSSYFEKLEKENIKNSVAKFPENLCSVSGTLKMLCDAINSSGQYLTPHLSLSCSVALLSCLYGRKWLSPTGARTNLFVVGLGMAGSGKENARKFIINIFSEIDEASQILGGSNIKSGAGLIKAMTNNSQRFYLLDEFGLVLQSISNDKSPQYLRDIAKILLEFYSASGSAYLGSDAASEEASTGIIKNPILSLYGTSTPSTFYKSITDQTIISGELPRYLVVDDPSTHKIDNLNISKIDIKPIINIIKDTIKYSRYGDYTGIDIINNEPIYVKYDNKNVENLYRNYRSYINKTYVDEVSNGLWSRACENVQKLATISAVSDNLRNPIITKEHMQWAIDFVDYSVSVVGSRVKNVIRSKYGEDRNKLLNFIKNNKNTTKTQINRYMQLKTKDLKELLDDLIESHEISFIKLKTKDSCKPKAIFNYISD